MDDFEAALEELVAADVADAGGAREDRRREEEEEEEEGKKKKRQWRQAKVTNKDRKVKAAEKALQQIESATVAYTFVCNVLTSKHL